jgi:hypothetical protein
MIVGLLIFGGIIVAIAAFILSRKKDKGEM